MGLFGFGWFKDNVEELKVIRDTTTDEQTKVALDKIISNLEKKK